MNFRRRKSIASSLLLLCALLLSGHGAFFAQDNDAAAVALITQMRAEALSGSSEVMSYLFRLTDVYGPRFSGSPGFTAAAQWARDEFARLGAVNVQHYSLDRWGYTEPGWSHGRFSVSLVEPRRAPLTALPTATSPSTHGRVIGEPVFFELPGRSGLSVETTAAKYKGQLRGKILMLSAEPVQMVIPSTSPFQRLTDGELKSSRTPTVPPVPLPPSAQASASPQRTAQQENDDFRRLFAFLRDEGVLAYLSPSRGEGGIVLATRGLGPIGLDPPPPPGFNLSPESYNRIVRLMQHRVPTRIEVELESTFHDAAGHVNVLGEITGSTRRHDVVLVGAHLDSWQGGTGATDNAAGCAVILEAMRILKKLKAPLQRTVRFALWGGEERGTHGSRAYVEQHQRQTQETLSMYFNLDGNGGRVRGLRVQGREDLAPMAERWLRPFRNDNDGYVAIRKTLGSDQFSFDQAGLPNMVFFTDPAFGARTYHSNMDFYDYVISEDLQRSAALVAAILYQAANE